MKFGLYPGCSLNGSAREYNESLRALAQTIGIDLIEVPDWNCCGATAAHNLNQDLALALQTRILAAAESAGIDELVVPCAACYSRLFVTNHELGENPALKEKASRLVDDAYQGKVRVINILELLDRIPDDQWHTHTQSPFSHKVACYYGCLLVRPHKILRFDHPEDPQSMDRIMTRIGATPIDWAFKVECCGAGFSVSRTSTVARLSGQIIADAVDRGAEAIIVACPMCHSNLDMRREKIEAFMNQSYDIPIIYITQAVGMAMGIPGDQLGLHRHKVPVRFAETGTPASTRHTEN
ncbi:MAG: CoB--CoM heterodisulfide reductase iron-sulfur subunit B family protein [Candidatus Omnitrophota bacterium]